MLSLRSVEVAAEQARVSFRARCYSAADRTQVVTFLTP
jgi:hypothetical protein